MFVPRLTLLAALFVAVTAVESHAQISGGSQLNLSPGVIERNNIAYDSVHDVYLTIVQRPPVVGRFLNKNGAQVGPDFQITTEAGDPFIAWVSIAFGGPANDPTFIVTYVIASEDGLNPKYARFVRYVPGGTPSVSAPMKIVDVAGEWQAAEKAQSVWNGSNWIVGTRVLPAGASFPMPQVNLLGMNGTLSAPILLGDGADFYGSPALACATSGVCVVTGFKAGATTSFNGGSYARRFDGATLAPLGGVVTLASGNPNEDQGVAFVAHTGRFLFEWFRGGGAFGYIDTRTMGTDGSLSTLDLGRGIGPGAGTNAIAYNPATETSLLVTKWTDASLVVMELGDDGYPIDLSNIVLITNWDGLVPDYLPSMAANPDDGQWLVSAKLSAGTIGKIIQGTLASDLIQNGTFGAGMASWSVFAQPTLADLVTSITNGVLSFYRQPLAPGTSGQGVVFQAMNVGVPADTTLTAVFDVGNSSTVRKRITILLHDADFSDLYVCTFWLQAAAPLRTYRINTHTNRTWGNATISFYAASTGSNGGAYLLDNVHVSQTTGVAPDRTECVDPTTPGPTSVSDSGTLLTNGDFSAAGLAPWGTFGQIDSQIAGGVFEFVRPPPNTAPAGVVLQPTGIGLPLHSRLTLTLSLGNSSAVRKRVTVLLHDNDFSDLSACTFWLEPGQVLAQHTVKTFTTKAWVNATVSVYAATVGIEQWTRLDDVSLRITQSAPMTGTECIEPVSAIQTVAPAGARRAAVGRAPSLREVHFDRGGGLGPAPIDLTNAVSPVLRFDVRGADGEEVFVEISRDGLSWTRLDIPLADDWISVSLDLSPFAGEVIYLRFVSGGTLRIRDALIRSR